MEQIWYHNPREMFPRADQPREIFDPESLRELAEDIKEHGIIEPLIVTPRCDAQCRIAHLPDEIRDFIDLDAELMIVAGERRWRAAHMAGLKEVPVIKRQYTDAEAFEIAFSENFNREDMKPMEEARALARLQKERSCSISELAKKFGRSPDFVRGRLALLNLDADIQALVNGNHIPLTVAISIARLSGDRQHRVVQLMNEDNLNAMQACFLADQLFTEQEQGQLFDLGAYMRELAAEEAAKWLAKAQTTTEKVKDALVTAIEQLPLPDLEETARLVQQRIATLTAPALACANGVHCGPGEHPKCPLCEFYLPAGDTGSCTAEGDDLDGEGCFVEYKPTLEELVEAETQKEADVNTIIGNRTGRAITDQVRVFVLKVPTDHKALDNEMLRALGQEPEKDHHLQVVVKRGQDVLLTIQVAERAEGGTADVFIDADFGVGDPRWEGVTFALEADHRYFENDFEGGELLYREEVADG